MKQLKNDDAHLISISNYSILVSVFSSVARRSIENEATRFAKNKAEIS